MGNFLFFKFRSSNSSGENRGGAVPPVNENVIYDEEGNAIRAPD